MITMTRAEARRLRAGLRRHALGITHKGSVPPLVLVADPEIGLRVRFRLAALAVEATLGGPRGSAGSLALPLDALAELEGRNESPVTLEPDGPSGTVARWEARGIPETRAFEVPRFDTLAEFPAPPADFTPASTNLLEALAAAAATTDPTSTRYALGCVQLRGGGAGEVLATDGRQLLGWGGFAFPWESDLLVRPVPLLGGRALPRDASVSVGRAEGHVVVRVGAWTLWLAEQEGRFPRTADALPPQRDATTRLHLDPADARFLADALAELPGGEDPGAPVTLDCNGRVVVRSRAGADGRPTEVVLARSNYDGEPVRLCTDRRYLARALALGLAEIDLAGASLPAAARAGVVTYGWQPLAADAALEPAADAVRIASDRDRADDASTPARCATTERRPMSEPEHRHGQAARTAEPSASTPGLGTLIAEAEALHTALGESKARATRLIAALRRHRKRSRLMESTLATLKQLKLAEVGE